ncbi:MAG: RNA-binding protein [Mogibacterium sp.]|nr:RNA-binding protein [Mogibacterium sp.]
MEQDAVFRSRIEDKIEQCLGGWYITTTGFLDLHEQSLTRGIAGRVPDLKLYLYGGYDEAERRMAIFAPANLAPAPEDALAMTDPLRAVRIKTVSGGRPLTHRDYLGSVLGLGLERSVIGDILVAADGADMIVKPEILQFLLQEYRAVGRTEIIGAEEIGLDQLRIPEKRVETVRDTIPSLRLDNVISAVFRISRAEAVRAIRSGLVYIDHVETDKIDRKVAEGNVLILRGKGKAVLTEVGGESRKGRIWVTGERYR